MHFLIRVFVRMFNRTLESNSDATSFSTLKYFRSIIFSILLLNLILWSIPILSLYIDQRDTDAIETLLFSLPSVIGLILLGISIPSISIAHQKIQLTKTSIKVNGQNIEFAEITKLEHSGFTYALVICSKNRRIVVSKYTKGFEHLFAALISRTNLSQIVIGKKTRLAKNYRNTVVLMAIVLSIIAIPAVAIMLDESPDDWFYVIPITTIGIIAGSLLLPLEFFRRYTFYNDHFVQHSLFASKEIPYQSMSHLELNKSQLMIHYKWKGNHKRMLPPMGTSLYDIYDFLSKKLKDTPQQAVVVH